MKLSAKLRSVGLSVIIAAAASAGGLVACAGTVEPAQSASGTKQAIGVQTHGVVKLVGEAFADVPLRDDQRAELEKLASEADARHAASGEGRKALMAKLADQIEKGAIDRAALQPELDRVKADMDKTRPADQQALARAHALLDAGQRNALVDALEARMREGHHGKRAKGEGGHGKGEGGPGKGEGHGGRGFGGMHGMHALAKDLNLTEEQRTKIREVMTEAREERKEQRGDERGPHGHGHGFGHGKRALEAFRSDSFDPAAFGPKDGAPGAGERFAAHEARMLDFAEKVVPVLTPDQRKVAADKLRAMPAGKK